MSAHLLRWTMVLGSWLFEKHLCRWVASQRTALLAMWIHGSNQSSSRPLRVHKTEPEDMTGSTKYGSVGFWQFAMDSL